MTKIEIYGKADDEICAGCEHECSSCTPGLKQKTIELVDQFKAILSKSELNTKYEVLFYESTPDNLANNIEVQRLLSMAALEPVICINKKITYLGGFSPQGLFDELIKRNEN